MGSSTSSHSTDRTELRRHGSYFEVDAAGFIVKAVSTEDLQPEWRTAVHAVVTAAQQHFGSALHSVYVRGSVAKGLAIPYVSDVDCMVAVRTVLPLRKLEPTWAEELGPRLRRRYPFASEIEILVGSVERARINRAVQVLFQTQALCVHGADLSNEFLRAKVGPESAVAFRHLSARLSSVRRTLVTPLGSHEVRRRCTWIMKDVLRAAFELVMERERKYTRDIFLCYESFARHYPTRAADMHHALDLAVNPPDDPNQVLAALERFDWLLVEGTKVLGPAD